jgi:hypothetical protein
MQRIKGRARNEKNHAGLHDVAVFRRIFSSFLLYPE